MGKENIHPRADKGSDQFIDRKRLIRNLLSGGVVVKKPILKKGQREKAEVCQITLKISGNGSYGVPMLQGGQSMTDSVPLDAFTALAVFGYSRLTVHK